MKITTRGRFTIPAAIRKRLGIYAGANVEFKLDGNVLRLYRQSLQSSATLAYLNS